MFRRCIQLMLFLHVINSFDLKNSVMYKFKVAAYFMLISDQLKRYHLPNIAARKETPFKEILNKT